LVCPHCGASTTAQGGTCAECGRAVPGNRVAAATLTPFPGPPTLPPTDQDQTRLASDPGGLAARPAGAPIGSLAPGDLFGPRYRILRLLGAGGMGIVYHAWDEELGVAVALKVIRPEVSADPATAKELEKRFKRELLLARQVTHHNVVRIHDIGEVERTKYITMSFIDGRDLATELKASGHLTVPQTLHLIRQLAEGLQAAHVAGVIHRDLKPANIMVEGDTAVIMDFGIARSAVRQVAGNVMKGTMPLSRSALVTGATMQGAVVGTVAYMSPEQAKGEPADQRSDIYAVGMIMRDMLVGMRNVENPTDALNELMARVEHAPKPVLEIDPTIPEDVDRIVTKCLQPDAAARYQNVQELLADLNKLDAEGKPLPRIRRLTKRVVYAAGLVVVALLGGTWWLAQPPPPPPDPISVLIADLENRTGEPVFDGAVEQALRLAMEGASFINAYPRVDAARVAEQLGRAGRIDESVARLVATREGIKFILAASIAKSGRGYEITVKALDPAREDPIASESDEASSRNGVLETVGSIAASVREELGDEAPRSARLAAADSFSASSLDAVKAYSSAQDLQNRGRKGEALAAYRQAIDRDPSFGLAYSGAAIMAFELGRTDEAEALWKKMLPLTDRMNERERYRTLGAYYLGVTRNFEKAIETYSNLVKSYPGDRNGRSNLALAYFWSLNIPKALEEGRLAVELDPKNLLHRSNYALYAMYAGDFDTATKETTHVIEQEPAFYVAYVPLAMAALARGDAQAAREAYGRMARTGAAGSSLATMGLADVALYEGRYAEAEKILKTGISDDQAAGNVAGMASKYAALGEAFVGLGQPKQAVAAADSALKLTKSKEVQLSAGAIFLRAGRDGLAKTIAAELSQQLQPQARAYGKLLEGRLALKQRRRIDAVEAFLGAQKLADSWLARFDLGVAYVEAGSYAEGRAELETAEKRRGEATAIFLDEVPSFRYLVPLHYWLGRAQEGVGASDGARKNFQQFLALRPGRSADALVEDARRRIEAR
jgi:eukaryotic-like serine/threonine-protein kinase